MRSNITKFQIICVFKVCLRCYVVGAQTQPDRQYRPHFVILSNLIGYLYIWLVDNALSRIGGVSLEKGAKVMRKKLRPTKLQSEFNMKGNRGKNAFGHTKLYICLRGKNLFFIMEQFLTCKMLDLSKRSCYSIHLFVGLLNFENWRCQNLFYLVLMELSSHSNKVDNSK